MDFNARLLKLEEKVDNILKSQEAVASMLAETNILLRRSLGFCSTSHQFPIKCTESLKRLDEELVGEKKEDITGVIKRILSGSLAGVERILSIEIIMSHNYDGSKDKVSLKQYGNFLNALYIATKAEGKHYENFVTELRQILKKIKNRCNKQRNREKENKSFEN